MGAFCCKWFTDREADLKAERDRMDALHAGAKFLRNDTYLGLTAKELWVRLANDKGSLAWRTTGTGTWTAAEFGEVDLTTQVNRVKSHGLQGIQFLDKKGKVVFDIQAEDTVIRDQWVIGLSELLQSWVIDPSTKPQTTTATGRDARAAELEEHFKNREADFLKNREAKLAAREAAANARKAKYSPAPSPKAGNALGPNAYSPLQNPAN